MAIALALAISLSHPGPASAQEGGAVRSQLVGTVLRDSVPVPDVPVTLHRVTPDTGSVIATSTTDQNGKFRFDLASVEGAEFTVFLVTADYLSARYFGKPIHPGDPTANYSLAVYDTTSSLAQPVHVVSRDVVLIPEEAGSWEVNEVVRIGNPGTAALVAGDGSPTWEMRIPERAAQFQVGEGDILPHEVSLMENRVLLLTPVTPGQKDLYIRYRLPAEPNDAAFPIDDQTESFNLFVQQPSTVTAVVGLQSNQMLEAEGEQFLQYGGGPLAAGSQVSLEWASTAPIVNPVIAAVATTIALLIVGLWAALRNRRPATGVT